MKLMYKINYGRRITGVGINAGGELSGIEKRRDWDCPGLKKRQERIVRNSLFTARRSQHDYMHMTSLVLQFT